MPGPLSTSLRTHTCGELREANVGETATLCGWVANYRDFGGVVFIDLRDRYGLTQLVFDPDAGEKLSGDGLNAATHELARALRGEDVVRATGVVRARGEGLENPKLATGAIEVRASDLTVLNKAKTPPFEPGAKQLPGEELRLKHPLHRPPPPGAATHVGTAAPALQGDPGLFRRPRLPGGRNADHGPQHPGGRPRLPRPQPRASRGSSTPSRRARSFTNRS